MLQNSDNRRIRCGRKTHFAFLALPLLVVLMTIPACQATRNFTTYYNRFWNMERIMAEVEDDVDYFREKEGEQKPRYVVPLMPKTEDFYSAHLDLRTFEPEEVRRHKIKLDSILLKGSILLTHQSKSDYVDDAIYYIAKTYFYEREWFQAAEQATDLIALYPDSDWQPDAHLLLAMSLLKMGEIEDAADMLSRTVDVAFRFKREDILTEAFRLNADVALHNGDASAAARPYERAILLSDDDEEQAAWQYDLGVVYFRAGQYDRAIEAFDRVDDFDPTDVTRFESRLQSAVAYRAAERYADADSALREIEEESDFEQWRGAVAVERQALASARSGGDLYDPETITRIDSLGGGDYMLSALFEQGVRKFQAGDYPAAALSFGRVQSSDNPLSKLARNYTVWLSYYKEQRSKGEQSTRISYETVPDSLAIEASRAFYNVSRFFVRYNVTDSAEHYLREAVRWGPAGSTDRAKATWALADFLFIKGSGAEADSLLEDLAENYGDNEWSAEARRRLGYTDDYVVDAARDLYVAGTNLMKNAGDYRAALVRFSRVWRNHAGTVYAPRALYASGLIFEEYLDQPDSALLYYSYLINSYPESEQALAVRDLVARTLAGGSTVDTSAGLDPTSSTDTTSVVDGTEADDASEVRWYDARLYDPNPALAMQRRGRRTQDLPD